MSEEQMPMWAVKLVENIARLSGKIDDLTDSIKGNGEPGLLRRVNRLERWQTKIVAVGALIASALSFVVTTSVQWFLGRHER